MRSGKILETQVQREYHRRSEKWILRVGQRGYYYIEVISSSLWKGLRNLDLVFNTKFHNLEG
jgi:hypothetical protein